MSFLFIVLSRFKEALKNRDHQVLLITQIILVLFVMLLSLSSNNIQHYFEDNLNNLLGADLVIESEQAIAPDDLRKLRLLTPSVSETAISAITLVNGEYWQKAEMKIVDDNYPIQGMVSVSTALADSPKKMTRGPMIGEIWIDSRLAGKLKLRLGQDLNIADTSLRVSGILQHEPDRLLEGHSVAMRAMVRRESLQQETLLENAKYRYLIGANDPQRSEISHIFEPQSASLKLLDRHKDRHPLASFWQRVENFFGLSSVILFFMAAIVSTMAGRRINEADKIQLALYQSFGLSYLRCLTIFLTYRMMLLGLAIVAGLAMAIALNEVVIESIQSLFPGIQATVEATELLQSMGFLFSLLLLLQMPVLWQLKTVKPMQLLRPSPLPKQSLMEAGWAVLLLSLLTSVYTDNWLLTAMMWTALLVTLLTAVTISKTSFYLLAKMTRSFVGITAVTLGLMHKRLLSKTTQILGLSFCATLLLFTLLLMRDLQVAVESNTRQHNGNLIVTDALQSHRSVIEEWSRTNKVQIKDMRPFVPASVIEINSESLQQRQRQPSETLARLDDPIRIAWTDSIPKNIQLQQGKWWSNGDKRFNQMVVEQEVMTDLGLSLGDTLTFLAGSQRFVFKIVASQSYKPGASSMTFWFQVPQSFLSQLQMEPHFMGSLELPEKAWPNVSQLLAAHPGITVTSLQELTDRFDNMLSIFTFTVFGFSGFVLALTFLVIVASVNGFRKEDAQRMALMRSFGSDASDCIKSVVVEWGCTGAIATISAIAGTVTAGFLIYDAQFSLTYEPDYLFLLAVVGLISMIIGLIGYGLNRTVINTSVRALLAE